LGISQFETLNEGATAYLSGGPFIEHNDYKPHEKKHYCAETKKEQKIIISFFTLASQWLIVH